MRPHRRRRDARAHPRARTLPAAPRRGVPAGGRVGQDLGHGRQPLALHAGSPRLPGRPGPGGVVECGIQPHVREAREGRRHPTQPPPPGDHGATARGAQHEGARGHPAPHHQAHGPGPGRPLRGRLATVPMGALGRGQHRHDGHGPDPLGPGHGAQAHQAQPAPPAGVDPIAVEGAHRIAIKPVRPALRATVALQGVVHAHAPWTGGGQGVPQQVQEQTRSRHARPDGAVQDAMIRLKGLRRRQAPHPKGGGDGPFTRGQQAPDPQHVSVVPHPRRHQGGKVASKSANALGNVSSEDLRASQRSDSLPRRLWAVQNG